MMLLWHKRTQRNGIAGPISSKFIAATEQRQQLQHIVIKKVKHTTDRSLIKYKNKKHLVLY